MLAAIDTVKNGMQDNFDNHFIYDVIKLNKTGNGFLNCTLFNLEVCEGISIFSVFLKNVS